MMCKIKYYIILFIIFCIVLFVLPHIYIAYFTECKYKIYRQVFTQEELSNISSCLELTNTMAIDCYKKYQPLILDKLKKRLNKKYMKVGHTRWSNGKINYDAQTYHRDIKPNFYFPKKYPNVYTIIIALDDLDHRQCNNIISLKKGDCLMFNSFNMHSGYNMGHIAKHKSRRILQLFHVFFSEKEHKRFEKDHTMVSHVQNNFVTKYVNGVVDLRSGLEYNNLMPIIIPNKSLENKTNYKYTTFIEPSQYITTIDGVDYYNKL